ncbi:MAG: anthranilate phosphoribosyltransferase [Proteobacteria bacterium]|nr:anthranilate phosphoribosyltransferase [Pseudomonadota bacterium]
MLRDLLNRVLDGGDLTRDEARSAIDSFMSGKVRPEQAAALLAGLRTKGETPTEIAGMAEAMRAHAVPVMTPVGAPVVDTCGTGGDGAHTINISTAAAFVVAAAGAVVAKHGNRSISSKCGSADVLEALGVKLDVGTEGVERCLEAAGIGFMFAPAHHPAMKHVMPVRRSLGVRTAFNLLGPLTNPAGARRQVIGVYSPRVGRLVAEALAELGSEHVLVVHGDGLDEITLAGPTTIWELKDGAVTEWTTTPAELGVPEAPLTVLKGGDAAQNAAALESILAGEPGPRGDAVAVNAGAALYVAGLADSLRAGVDRSRELLASGAAVANLNALRKASTA